MANEVALPLAKSDQSFTRPRVAHAGIKRDLGKNYGAVHKVYYEFCLVTSGLSRGFLNSEPVAFDASSVFICQPDDILDGKNDAAHGTYTSRWVQFDFPHSEDSHCLSRNRIKLPRVFKLSPVVRQEFQGVFDALLDSFSGGWDGWEIGASGYLLAMIAILSREATRGETVACRSSPIERRLGLALTYMERNFARNIKIGEVAESAGMSESYFVRMFRKHFNLRPNEQLIRMRLKEARRLLAKDPLVSISEACQQAGFGDQRYFATVFKARYRLTPSEFRNSLKWHSA
jgi:AraC-like DNA-binding protein